MPLGSFTFVIDGDQLDGTEETSATVTLRLQGPTVLKDGTKLRFHTPLANGAQVTLPHSVELPTDTTGTDISTTIGYVATVSTPNGSQRTATFAARADGVTLYMASVVTLETVDPVEAAEYAARAELARDEAEAAAAAAQAVGDTNATIMAGVDADAGSAFRVQQDARFASNVDASLAAADADAGSDFRTQHDPRMRTEMDSRARRLFLSGQTLSSVQTWLDTMTSGSVASLVGSLTIPTGDLVVPAGVTLDLSAATLTQQTATDTTLTLSAGSRVRGGTINTPASWNNTTTGKGTDAVVMIPLGADGCEISGVSINNVYRIGIAVDADYTRIHDCRIEGNLPSGYYTGTETSHFAIMIDPSGTSADGATVIADNVIGGCVQGVFIGNYSTGVGRGVVVSGNLFHDCWNHGIYQSHGNGMTFASNTFQRCQIPIVASNQGCTIVGNTCWTTETGDQRDVTGIQLRNARDGVIVSNTIIGDGNNNTVAINLDNTLGGTFITRNVIANNTVNLAGGSNAPVIRVGNSGLTQTLRSNRVSGNVIRAAGQVGSALIEVAVASGYTGIGNVVDDNTIVIAGECSGIELIRQKMASVSGNHVRLEYNAGSSASLMMVKLNPATDSRVADNTWGCESNFGTNITVYGVREYASCDRNILGPNAARWDMTLLAGSFPTFQAAAGNASIVGTVVGEHTAATTLGTLNGKVGIYDDKGTLLGWAPVYNTIT